MEPAATEIHGGAPKQGPPSDPPRIPAPPASKSKLLTVILISAAIAAAIAGGTVIWLQKYYFLGNFGVVKENALYRCKQPMGLKWGHVRGLGIRTVINLRREEENPAAFAESVRECAAGGIAFVNIPMWHCLPNNRQIEEFIRAARGAEPPVLVHCEFGKQRTGVVLAAFRIVVDGWTVPQAMEEMVKYHRGISPGEKEQSRAVLEPIHRDRQEWLNRTAPGRASRPASAPSA